MEKVYLYAIIGLAIAVILLGVWILHLINKGKKELVYTKEELNHTIKYLESEINKIKKNLTKHTNYHDKTDNKSNS
ncbi:MAG TPA: hypothetical protein PLY32_02560 [Salinivirgaceae bacterium]|nr:hypothetical protein [Salinivirgaceae bacterium]HQA75979.1 hypothetical protein [Salinivirgaceae bacterium]